MNLNALIELTDYNINLYSDLLQLDPIEFNGYLIYGNRIKVKINRRYTNINYN
jgi:hypothetical protein